MAPGHKLNGPALIDDKTTTVLVVAVSSASPRTAAASRNVARAAEIVRPHKSQVFAAFFGLPT